jgi:hypothetical protein
VSRWTRWSEDRAATAYTAVVSVGFVAAVLGPSLIGLRALISVNAFTSYLPWRADALETAGHQRCTGDTIDTIMPSTAFLRHEWLHGHLGAWQGFIGGGSPLGALPNMALLDPLSLPYFILPLWMAPAFVKLLELVVGGGGTYLFLRRLGVSRPAGMLAALIFGTSGFMVMWSNWPQTRVAALIPPLFWAVERLVQRLRLVDVALVALVVASLILGGFPSVTAWALEAATVYFILRLGLEYRDNIRDALRGIGLGILGIVTGALLAMIQLLPFIKVYSDSNREVRSSYGLIPLATTRLITLVSPNAFGLCTTGEPRYDGTSPVENVTYIGAAALILALVGACVRHQLVRRAAAGHRAASSNSGLGVTMYFAVAAAVIIVIGWTSRHVLQELQPIPPFKGNPVGRIRAVLGFALAVLAGFGFDAIMRRRSPTRVRPSTSWIRPVVIATGAAVAGAGVVLKAHANAVNGHYWDDLRATLYVPALLVAATLVVLALAATGYRWPRWLAIAALPLLVVGQGAFFFHRVLPGDDPDNFYRRTAVHEFLQRNLGHDRFETTGQVMYPTTSLYYRLRIATGHTPQAQEWQDLLHSVDPDSSLSPTFTAFTSDMTPDRVGSSKILDRLSVRYWVFSPDVVTGDRVSLPPTSDQTTVAADATASCQLRPGPLRGLTIGIAAPVHLADPLHPATITVVAHNGARSVTSSRAVVSDLESGSTFAVGIPGEDFGGATTVALTAKGLVGPLVLDATAAGAAACAPIRPSADHLRLVYAGAGAIVYQRLDALDRIRWTGRSEVISDPARQLTALAAGVPADTVVLDAPAGAPSSGTAVVNVLRDDPGRIGVRVQAQGSGYLTVADAMVLRGWSVTVDGKHAPLLVGDHALGTVAVPAGVHTVEFRYHSPGFHAGLALSGLGLAGVIAMVVFDRRRRRDVDEPDS